MHCSPYWTTSSPAGLSAAGYTIYSLLPTTQRNSYLLSIQVISTLVAVPYLAAAVLCEPNPAHTGNDEGQEEGEERGGAWCWGRGGGGGSVGIRAATGTTGAPKETPGTVLFGGTATATRSSMFEGGSLFGGSAAKYGGYGTDKPEVNPFLKREGGGAASDDPTASS